MFNTNFLGAGLRSVLLCTAVLSATLISGQRANADQRSGPDWQLSLESGAEYDSNLHRVEVLEGDVVGVDSGSLLRMAARYQGVFRPHKKGRLRLDLHGASKIFTDSLGQSENLAVVFASVSYQAALAKTRAIAGLRTSYYDALDIRPFGDGERPVPGRSFRSTEIEASLTLPSQGAHRLALVAGFRGFSYKPDSDYSWSGLQVGGKYVSSMWIGDKSSDEAASLDFRASYLLGVRSYQGVGFRNACSPSALAQPMCFVPTTDLRSDMNHLVIAEVVYTGQRIYSLRYGAEVVDSSSYGQALVRQRVELGITAEIPGNVFVTARAVVRFNTFLDPLILARNVQDQSFVSVEDENRNALSLHLARDLSPRWGVEARLAIYSNEFATQQLGFRRQTAYLGLLYRFQEDSASSL